MNDLKPRTWKSKPPRARQCAGSRQNKTRFIDLFVGGGNEQKYRLLHLNVVNGLADRNVVN